MLAAPPPLLQSLVPSMLGGCVLGLASAAVFAQGQILGVSGAVGCVAQQSVRAHYALVKTVIAFGTNEVQLRERDGEDYKNTHCARPSAVWRTDCQVVRKLYSAISNRHVTRRARCAAGLQGPVVARRHGAALALGLPGWSPRRRRCSSNRTPRCFPSFCGHLQPGTRSEFIVLAETAADELLD